MIKKKIIFILLVSFLVVTAQWLFGQGYIEITLENPTNNEVTYRIVDQKNGKIIEIKSKETKLKRRVSNGTYEILVSQGETSYFSVVKSGRFLGKTSLLAKVIPQKYREFVGNNPGPCMHFTNQVLLSFGCKDLYKNAQVHVPATAERPTYTQKSPTVNEGIIEGMITTNEGSLALIKAPRGEEDQGAPHTIYSLKEGLQLSIGTPLSDLDQNKTYSILPFKSGFIVYDASYTQILFYSSTKAKPEKVDLAQPTDPKLKLYSLNIQNDSIVAAYTTGDVGDTVDDNDIQNTEKTKTEIIINLDNTSRNFTFKGSYGSPTLCGSSKLCLLRKKQLEVFDISGKKQKLLFVLGDVESIKTLSGSLVLVRGQELLGLDVDTRQGSIEYRLGDYSSCGLQEVANGYTLCLVNSKNKKVALYINPKQPNTDDIDKKVSELLKLPDVTDVSIYGKFIFVSPDLGELVYDKASKMYQYDPVTKKIVNEKINQEINRLGINRTSYTIINSFK